MNVAYFSAERKLKLGIISAFAVVQNSSAIKACQLINVSQNMRYSFNVFAILMQKHYNISICFRNFPIVPELAFAIDFSFHCVLPV